MTSQDAKSLVGESGHFAGPHGEAAFLADGHQRGHELRFSINIRYPSRIMDEYGIYIYIYI